MTLGIYTSEQEEKAENGKMIKQKNAPYFGAFLNINRLVIILT